MKQILQDLSNGETSVVQVPPPAVKPGHLLIRSSVSLISAGTERMLVEFGRSNIIDKARQQPDKVRMVLDKVKTDGLKPTIEAVQSKLDQPLPLGYSNVGVVIGAGLGVSGFEPGDRVVSNGNHAEIVCVPRNLCARIPEGVDDDLASFTVVSAIALQGIRLLQPTLGENIVVTGLGLIGLVAVQLLKANGCNVLGVDLDPAKVALAKSFGADAIDVSSGEDPVEKAMAFSGRQGVDGVLLTASTKSDEPVHQAAEMCRKRGRIVLVGVTGLKLSRADFYEKELSFQVSCSYGPGRYDTSYEEKGNDYPYGFVRWTEQRNFEAVLGLMQQQRIQVSDLVSHKFEIDAAAEAYDILANENPMGIVLQYPQVDPAAPVQAEERTINLSGNAARAGDARVSVGMIGSGGYATRTLIPAFKNAGATLGSLCSAGGVSSTHAGKKFGFAKVTTDAAALIADNDINTVVIATRHDTHAQFVESALAHGKNVFVEKPLVIQRSEVEGIMNALRSAGEKGAAPLLMVGYNRRFSPLVIKAKELLDVRSEPKSFIMTVAAWAIPDDHWIHDPAEGGGRIIAEACHFIDLLRFLAGAPIKRIDAVQMGQAPGVTIRDDKVSITMEFTDGSFGTIHYLSNGHKSFPKERLEVFCGGSVLQLDNFKSLTGYGWPGFKKMKTSGQKKGNAECAAAFVDAIRNGTAAPIPLEETLEITEATFLAIDALQKADTGS